MLVFSSQQPPSLGTRQYFHSAWRLLLYWDQLRRQEAVNTDSRTLCETLTEERKSVSCFRHVLFEFLGFTVKHELATIWVNNISIQLREVRSVVKFYLLVDKHQT